MSICSYGNFRLSCRGREGRRGERGGEGEERGEREGEERGRRGERERGERGGEGEVAERIGKREDGGEGWVEGIDHPSTLGG